MDYRTYWEEDCTLVRAYRKAYEIRQEQLNAELWLQGLYFYEALCDVSPVLNAFAKSGTRPRKYTAEPYPLKQKKTSAEDKYQHARAVMEGYMKRFNKKFEKKEAVE